MSLRGTGVSYGQVVIKYIKIRYQKLLLPVRYKEKLFLERAFLIIVDVQHYKWGMSLQLCFAALGALAVHQKTPAA